MSKGIVVDNKENGMRHAISESNFRDKLHVYVRDLLPGETIWGFRPKRKDTLGDPGDPTPTPGDPNDQETDPGDSQPTLVGKPKATPGPTATTKTEGSSTEGTKESK